MITVCNQRQGDFNRAGLVEAGAYEKQWFALRVKSNRENVVAHSLSGKGYSICLPTYRRAGRSGRPDVEAPLFPGYLFCEFDQRVLLPILVVPGVVNVLSLGNVPEPVNSGEIFALQQLMRSGVRSLPRPYLASGQKVRVHKGPLAGVEGTVLREKGEMRLVISVAILVRSVVAEVDRDWVESIAGEGNVLESNSPEPLTLGAYV